MSKPRDPRRPAPKKSSDAATPTPTAGAPRRRELLDVVAEGLGIDRSQDIGELSRRVASRKKPFAVAFENVEGRSTIGPPAGHDKFEHTLARYDTFATGSEDFIKNSIAQLMHGIGGGEGKPLGDTALNGALAMIAAVAPENELEAALALEMAACHTAAMNMLGATRKAEILPHLTVYGNLAVKLQRTFVAQIEALARLRGKGQQTVRVEHVTVQPGAQAIVGDVHHHTPGGGAAKQSEDQPLGTGKLQTGAALPSPDPFGNGVPLTCNAERPVPIARRAKSGGAER